ncbi:MAG: nuclear receptor NHR-99 [Syntrophobacteraceae bacterium]
MNRVAAFIEEIEDEAERKEFRKGLGSIMAYIYTDLELPIIRQYPEFDPDKE